MIGSDLVESSATQAAVLEFKQVSKSFGNHQVLAQVDFRIDKGELVCIVGPNGSGKTTLLRCMNLLVEPTGGSLFFKGALVGEWPGRQRVSLREYRRHIGMVF